MGFTNAVPGLQTPGMDRMAYVPVYMIGGKNQRLTNTFKKASGKKE